MRQIGIVLVFGLGVGVGCAAGTAVQTRVAQAQAPVTRWEYQCLWPVATSAKNIRKKNLEKANKLGREGWELVGDWCLKRPLP